MNLRTLEPREALRLYLIEHASREGPPSLSSRPRCP
jgi:hypothetical protein